VTGAQVDQWNTVIKDGKVNVAKGMHAAPEIIVTADTTDILAVAEGKLDPTQAFMQGKAKIQVDLTEALDLVKVFMPNEAVTSLTESNSKGKAPSQALFQPIKG
jgi:putative sterol carrier protein